MSKTKSNRPPVHWWVIPGVSISYCRISDVPEDDREEFVDWMEGSIRPTIPDLEPQDAVYAHDYDLFLKYKRGKPAAWD